MSKGSAPRPIQDRKKFDENWDKIFDRSLKVEAVVGGVVIHGFTNPDDWMYISDKDVVPN